jgi:phosphatidate cytidylyltransferase
MIDKTQLVKRLLMSFVLVPFAYYAIFFSPSWFFVLVVAGFMLLALWEYFALAEKKGYFINRYLGLVFAAFLVLPSLVPGDSIVLTCAVLCIFIFNFHKSLKEQAIVSTALTVFGLIYVGWFFSFLTKIRVMEQGALWVFYTVLIIKCGDAGAYFFGKTFGINKFATHISPNKSIEGAMGGFLVTFMLSLASKLYLPYVPIWHFALLGGVIGVLAQLGDLAESLLKRDAGVKDSGNLPGLGGILDVIDSLLLPIPIVYYYLTLTQGI